MIRTTAYQERLDALSTGAEGERLAAEYLLKEGFDLLHRNWRNGRCEIDLVARRDGVLHLSLIHISMSNLSVCGCKYNQNIFFDEGVTTKSFR